MTAIRYNHPHFDVAKKKAIVQIIVISNGLKIYEYKEVDLIFDDIILFGFFKKEQKAKHANLDHIKRQLIGFGYLSAESSSSACTKKRDGRIYKCNLYFVNNLDKGERTSENIHTKKQNDVVDIMNAFGAIFKNH